jgi:hypothetical protein
MCPLIAIGDPIMPKAEPISLHPMSLEEAIAQLIRVNPGNNPRSAKKKLQTKESK